MTVGIIQEEAGKKRNVRTGRVEGRDGGREGGRGGCSLTSSAATPSFFAAAARASSTVLPTTHLSLCACGRERGKEGGREGGRKWRE